MNELGSYLRQLRKDQDISINKLVELSGVSKGYISQIENGFIPSRKIIRKIASGLTKNNKKEFGSLYKKLLSAAGYNTDWKFIDEVKKDIEEKAEKKQYDIYSILAHEWANYQGIQLTEKDKQLIIGILEGIKNQFENNQD